MIRLGTFRALGIAALLVTTALGGMRPGHPLALAQSRTAHFEPGSCPFTLGVGMIEGKDVRCGYLEVPEDRSQPGGREIRLAVAIFKSSSATPRPDPVTDLEGGPGASALMDWGPYITKATAPRYVGDHDLILLDQRGTGYSHPSLGCPELSQPAPSSKSSPTPKQIQALALAGVRRCHDRLLRADVDLNAYTTLADAADVADLRTALGYPEVHLYGGSYGTRLALEVMRSFPTGIRSAVLDSVDPPQGTLYADTPRTEGQGFETLFSACARSPRCNAVYPHLKQTFARLVTRLNAKPVPITVTSPTTHRKQRTLLDGTGVASSLYLCLFLTPCIPAAPDIIYRTWSGNYTLVSKLFVSGGIMSGLVNWGMHLSVECAEDAAYTTPQQIAASAQNLPRAIRASVVAPLVQQLAWCKPWNVKKVDASRRAPVTSSIPTLLEGQFDPVTPPSNGAITVQSLSHGYLNVFPGIGHGVRFSNPCTDGIVWSFLDNPAVSPDASCVRAMNDPWS